MYGNRRKPGNLYIFLIAIAAFLVILAYLSKRSVENLSQTVTKPQHRKEKETDISKKDKPEESQIQESPEIRPGFLVYDGIVEIEQDIDITRPGARGKTGLDGMSKEEIATFRLEKVEIYRELNFFNPDYHPFKRPHRRIYAQITPGEGWLSPTTYYIANPYLLIVVTCANHVTPINLDCPDVDITYENGFIIELHTGQNAACWYDRVFNSYDYPGKVCPQMVNAWDAGFRYMHVDISDSLNIETSDDPQNVTNCIRSSRYFYHVGKYGVNNLSPTHKKDWLTLLKRNEETKISIKLWREKPGSTVTPADIVYMVNVIPDDRNAY